MNKIKVACFGLQGFGNDLLRALADKDNVQITTLYTRKGSHPFGYYSCGPIEDLAESLGVPVQSVGKNGNWECRSSDLAIISSFHRVLKKENLNKFRYVINIHPSLLPDYGGATPTNWMIKNGEKIVGLSAHLVEESVDSGPILFQKKLLNPYLNDNQLRKALSFLVKEIVSDIIESYPGYNGRINSDPGRYFPARTAKDGVIKLEEIGSIEELIFHIKAFTNYPMPKIKLNDETFIIDYQNPLISQEITLLGEKFSLLGYWQNTQDE